MGAQRIKRPRPKLPKFNIQADENGIPRISSRQLATALGLTQEQMAQLIEDNRDELLKLGSIAKLPPIQ